MKILLVDDDPATLKIISAFLSELDCEIETAQSAEEAMEVLGMHTGQDPTNPVDLIITDYEMPGLNGAELTEIVRTHQKLRHTHVIMVTTHDNLPTLEKAYKEGVVDFIGKPAKKEELLEKVNEIFQAISRNETGSFTER